MKRRPNPFIHMMAWGFGSGSILALAYLIIIVDFSSGFEMGLEILQALVNPILWQFAFMFGGIPGAIMGFFCGLLLWGFLRKAPIPFTRDHMREKRLPVYTSTFLITTLLSFLILSPFLQDFLAFFLILPPFIAAIAAAYAAHRYMFRLRLWSGGIESRKAKEKNDAYLRLADDAAAVHADYHEPTSQQKQDTLS